VYSLTRFDCIYVRAMDLTNTGHFGTAPFVLCREVVLFGWSKMYWNYKKKSLGPHAASFVERLLLFWSIHYWRFHCVLYSLQSLVYSIRTSGDNLITVCAVLQKSNKAQMLCIQVVCTYRNLSSACLS
jgi:hypothetical protein